MPWRCPLRLHARTNGELSRVTQELAGLLGPARLARGLWLAWPMVRAQGRGSRMLGCNGGGNAAGTTQAHLAITSPLTALARGLCEAETELRGLASCVAINIVAPADLRSGGAVREGLASPLPLSPDSPMFAAIPGVVRIKAPALTEPARGKDPQATIPRPTFRACLPCRPPQRGPTSSRLAPARRASWARSFGRGASLRWRSRQGLPAQSLPSALWQRACLCLTRPARARGS